MINADKVTLWKEDVKKSVDLYNEWFVNFAPKAYRDTRIQTTMEVKNALEVLDNLTKLSPEVIQDNPSIVPVLRMCTAPPIARDRLTGLGYLNKSILSSMEKTGACPPRMSKKELKRNFEAIASVIEKLLDKDIFTWLNGTEPPFEADVYRASTIIADRLCGSIANPIIKNAQEQRQLEIIESFLVNKGYIRNTSFKSGESLLSMEKGTFSFRMNIPISHVNGTDAESNTVNVPIDVVIMRKDAGDNEYPILIECKSAGDFTNTNKRRKEEATKVRQLRNTYGDEISLYLFLCGYFDAGYLGYEAAEGLDWIWEHRIEDLERLVL